jgi:hypothetical protein
MTLFRKDKIASPEGAPRLKAVKVEAETIGEAMGKAENGAGQAELDWVLANPMKAAKMLKGGSYYFFPNAGGGGLVPCVGWHAGEFWRSSPLRDDGWYSDDRVVVLD